MINSDLKVKNKKLVLEISNNFKKIESELTVLSNILIY